MYKSQDRKTLPLFPELFPFGGKLNENNRWLRVSELIPWEELEDEYRKHFSDVGRPAKDARLAGLEPATQGLGIPSIKNLAYREKANFPL